MMKTASMLAGLSLALGDTSALDGSPTLTPTKARRSKEAFVKSQAIRANRRKAKTRSKRCLD